MISSGIDRVRQLRRSAKILIHVSFGRGIKILVETGGDFDVGIEINNKNIFSKCTKAITSALVMMIS
jgi:hypothetical protein